MADICLSEKGAGVRPFVVGAMKPALFEESERRIKNATEVVGRNAESGSILAGNIQPMRNEPSNTNTGTAKQPQITGGKVIPRMLIRRSRQLLLACGLEPL